MIRRPMLYYFSHQDDLSYMSFTINHQSRSFSFRHRIDIGCFQFWVFSILYFVIYTTVYFLFPPAFLHQSKLGLRPPVVTLIFDMRFYNWSGKSTFYWIFINLRIPRKLGEHAWGLPGKYVLYSHELIVFSWPRVAAFFFPYGITMNMHQRIFGLHYPFGSCIPWNVPRIFRVTMETTSTKNLENR